MNEHVSALVRNGVCLREDMGGVEPGKSNRTRRQQPREYLRRALQAARTAGAKARRPVHTSKVPGMRRGEFRWRGRSRLMSKIILQSSAHIPPSLPAEASGTARPF